MDAEQLNQALYDKMAAEQERFRRELLSKTPEEVLSHLKPDVKGVLAEFGPERVTYVLAATIQGKEWDERFSRDNKAWAAAVPMAEPQDRRCFYTVNSHSTLLNGFVGMVRKELDAMREKPEQKPSIKEQLAAKPVPGETPAKPRDREAR